MFETMSWFFRYIFTFIILSFLVISFLIYFKDKVFLQPFLLVLNVILSLSSHGLLASQDEIIRYDSIYVSLIFCSLYVFTRLCLWKILKIKSFLIYDITSMLLSTGLIMLYRLDPKYAYRQIFFIFLSSITYFIVFYLMKKIKFKTGYWKYIGAVILFTLIITQLYGIQVFGAKNWIEIYSLRFQPSEFLKILFVIYISLLLHEGMDNKIFLHSGISVAIAALFFAMQKDLGSSFIFLAVYIIMLFLVDDKIYPTIVSTLSITAMAAVSYFTFSHIRSRVEAWLNPWRFISDKSYQVTQSLFAIASGGFIGTGLLLGNPNYIPAVHTDFIFSAFIEETGIINGISILFLLGLLIMAGFRIGLECENIMNKLISIGLTSMTAIQTLVIVCGVLNIIPITGVTLPFVSYGGSSLLSQVINISILYFIDSQNKNSRAESRGKNA